eukprot:UN22598
MCICRGLYWNHRNRRNIHGPCIISHGNRRKNSNSIYHCFIHSNQRNRELFLLERWSGSKYELKRCMLAGAPGGIIGAILVLLVPTLMLQVIIAAICILSSFQLMHQIYGLFQQAKLEAELEKLNQENLEPSVSTFDLHGQVQIEDLTQQKNEDLTQPKKDDLKPFR